MTRKLLYAAFLLPVLFSGCTQKDIYSEVDYNVTLDPSNTYVAGEPVTFNFTGDVENIIFYSGEIGSEYQYRDRYTVSTDEIESATLNLRIEPRYGEGTLDVWYSTSFTGLNGSDGDADRATLQAMEDSEDADGNLDGWQKITVWDADNPEQSLTERSVSIDVSESLDNFSLAFLWDHERADVTQRHYYVNGDVSIVVPSYGTITTDLSSFVWTPVMMNTELDAYHKNSGNGSIVLDGDQDIHFNGCGAGDLEYTLKGWCVSTPQSLNSVTNDQGTVIKNMQNYMSSYSYTYDEPGTYQAVFVGRNANYLGSSEEVKQFQVTILSRPVGSETE